MKNRFSTHARFQLSCGIAIAALSITSAPRPVVADEGFVSSDGAELYYYAVGQGEPILLIHGGPGFDHQQFLPFVQVLTDKHRIIMYDQRATGRSTGPTDSVSISMDSFLDDIDAMRRHFNLERVNLLGHSWGGMLAMHYATRYPERLRTLILVSTAASSASFVDTRANVKRNRSAEDAALVDSLLATDGVKNDDAAAIEHFWRVYFRAYFADPSLADKLRLNFTANTLANGSVVARNILRSAGAFDLHDALANVSVPTLIIHGDYDVMPVSYARRTHQSIPGSELVIVEGAGHWLFVDATDEFEAAIEGFLDRIDK